MLVTLNACLREADSKSGCLGLLLAPYFYHLYQRLNLFSCAAKTASFHGVASAIVPCSDASKSTASF